MRLAQRCRGEAKRADKDEREGTREGKKGSNGGGQEGKQRQTRAREGRLAKRCRGRGEKGKTTVGDRKKISVTHQM
jgi:hypothetical protein